MENRHGEMIGEDTKKESPTISKKRYKRNNYFSDEEDFSE